jgi:hypothetical protein
LRHTDFTGKDKWAGTLLRLTPGLRYALTRARVEARAALEQVEKLWKVLEELGERLGEGTFHRLVGDVVGRLRGPPCFPRTNSRRRSPLQGRRRASAYRGVLWAFLCIMKAPL